MHRPYCKSLVILTSYPPQYQKCNCGEDDLPQEWPKHMREAAKDKYEELKNRTKNVTLEDSFKAGYEKGLKDCYHVLLNKNFMTDDGRWTLAVDSIKECMNEIDKLFGE